MPDSCDVYQTSSEEPRLKIFTLGQFAVYKDSETATANFRNHNKAWALFIYLLTNRRRPNTVEDIYEALWGDEECSNPSKNICNLVHRLRKKIDFEKDLNTNSSIVYSQGCYFWNRNSSCWLDVDVFENLYNEANLLKETDIKMAAEKYREAVSLYRGVYLPLFSNLDWVITTRYYYYQLYLRNVFELLEIYKKEKNFSAIAKLCENVFLIEQFDEELHRHYLEALLEEGKIAQAKNHYEYITAKLYHEFGAKPSKAFQNIYRSIRNSLESLEFDLNSFREALKGTAGNGGALSCDFETFAMLSKIEKHRIEREKNQLFIAVLTVTGSDFRPAPTIKLNESMSKLDREIASNLRCGDVYSRWNESQIALLLKTHSPEKANEIICRIKNNASRIINPDTAIVSNIYPHLFL